MNTTLEAPIAAQSLADARHDVPPVANRRNTATVMGGEFLNFRLCTEEYGINILQVQEIRSYEPPTRIANAPPHVKGVVNLRGAIVPVVDLRQRMGCERVEYTSTTAVIVLNLGRRVVGAVVDAVSDVAAIQPSDVAPAPQLHAARDAHCITGIAKLKAGDAERLLILLDIESLLEGDIGEPESPTV